MERVEIGQCLQIHSYKHDGSIHRGWDEALVLDVTDEYMVCGNYKTTVYEKSGSRWQTREPAIIYFFHHKWFNIIAQLKKDGLYYYCNIASPFIVEENTIKYIDYDLDLRVFPTGDRKILDEMEYAYHRNQMKYDDRLDLSIRKALEDLNKYFLAEPTLINSHQVNEYYKIYKNLKKQVKS